MRVVALASLLVACGHAAPVVEAAVTTPEQVAPAIDPETAPHAGAAGGCMITHAAVMYWASDMLMVSPPETDEHGLTRAAALVTAHLECSPDAAPGTFEVSGWVVANGDTTPAVSVRGQRDDGTPWSFDVAPGASLDVHVVAEGPFLAPETPMRALLRWRAPDGSSIELGTDLGWLVIAS